MEKTEIIKYSRDGRWLISKTENLYCFFEITENEAIPAKTPSGKTLVTKYLKLAERILDDLTIYGTDYMSAESVLPWHYTMMDNFVTMNHEQIETMLDECFLKKRDWTYRSDHSEIFGCIKERNPAIRDWLSKCTHMQLTAACCIGNAYHSINIAYVLATLLENYTEKTLSEQFKALAEIVEKNSMYDDFNSILQVFDTFNLYYGIHNEEDGAIINTKLSIIG